MVFANQRTRKGSAGFPTFILSALLLAMCATMAQGVELATIDAAIQKAIKRLYSVQKDGIWELDPGTKGVNGNVLPSGMHHGGLTAIATYALLAAGESPTDPKLVKAIDFLEQLRTGDAYVIGVRAQIWKYLPRKAAAPFIAHDAELLLTQIRGTGTARGLFYYPAGYPSSNEKAYDHSISQFGVLGLWAGAENGAEIPEGAWQVMDQAWRGHQSPEGSWAYITAASGESGENTLSITSAGVASLLFMSDYLDPGVNGASNDMNVDRGLKWIADNFSRLTGDDDRESEVREYTLYGIERIGVAGGFKYFGKINWFDRGCDFLLKNQHPDGSWGSGNMWGMNAVNVPDTAFGILFFVNGRAPVMIDKLSYTNALKHEDFLWNQHPRDIANLVRWAGAEVESLLNWHVVTLDAPMSDLHEAPILYLSGSEALSFNDADMAKLRQFVEEGGMLLANANDASAAFSRSVIKLCGKLFPIYEFRELPANHIIYAGEQFPTKKFTVKPRIMGVSNGVRELCLLIPDQDPARSWQSHLGTQSFFPLGTDIIEYATERRGLDSPLPSYVVTLDPAKKATRSAAVARLVYPGNWDPEPAGWRRVSAILHNQYKLDLHVEAIKLGEGKLVPAREAAAQTDATKESQPKLAHLTGTTRFSLTPPQRQEIKNFVSSGGTLVVDAAGGSTVFANSAEDELAAIFGRESVASALASPLPLNDSLYRRPDARIDAISYRTFEKQRVGAVKAPRVCGVVQNGRVVAYFSGEDLSAGLVGEQVDGIGGYTPESATAIMRNIVLLTASAH